MRLDRTATCMVTAPGGTLVLAGPQSDDQLGRLWTVSSEALPWQPLKLRKRELVEQPESAGDVRPKRPDFTQVRSKLSGPAVSTLSVDAVISATRAFWVARDTGTILERPTASPARPRAVDAVIPSCSPGATNPASGCPSTPARSASRAGPRDVFPLQVALRGPMPEVAGQRPRIPSRWIGPELFDALVNECKPLLKVLW